MTLAGGADDPHAAQMWEELQTTRAANARLRQEIAGLHAVLEARPARALEPLNVREESIRRSDLEIQRLLAKLNAPGRMTINGAP